MERELIAALLLDDKLGNLSDTSSNLLTRFIDGNYEYEILANEINQTVSAVERSLAGDHTFELPPLKFQTAHTINKTALRLFATAALVLFAISLLYLWPDNTSPAVKPQVGQVASVSSLPQPE
ncbi:MAG: hypothetical protein JW745_03830, partial [Sedimentisphaerales bacterium]|nr:hypothetical protein [Sedimentisphaerales bacterium]